MIRIFFLLAAVTVAGCGDDTSMSSSDLAVAAADMAVPADLSILSCSRVLACVASCGANVVCQASCRDAGSSGAKSAYDAFAGCVAFSCSSVDGGTGACMNATDTRAGCVTCLGNVNTNAPNPGATCHTEYVACASN